MVHYCIAIAEYSKLCLPLKAAKEKLESIKQEQLNYEKAKQEREAEVSISDFRFILILKQNETEINILTISIT